MPGLRSLLRVAPLIVAALAAVIWLRRHAEERPRLGPPHAAVAPALPERTRRFEREPIDIVTVVDDLLDVGR